MSKHLREREKKDRPIRIVKNATFLSFARSTENQREEFRNLFSRLVSVSVFFRIEMMGKMKNSWIDGWVSIFKLARINRRISLFITHQCDQTQYEVSYSSQ